jgi:hypothetical protein
MSVRWLVVALVLGAASAARAAPCPAEVPEGSAERRALAGEWFRAAETAERAGDDLGAIGAYRCSLRIVPHAFTAYNLARAAEHAGDLELALDSYRQYLVLRPQADDRATVERQMQQLEERMAAARAGSAAPVTGPPPLIAPVTPAAEPADPAVRVVAPSEPRVQLGPLGWAVAGLGTASLMAGVVLNVMARQRMAECRTLAPLDRPAARDACHEARPYAYGSYGLLAGAAAAAAVDVGLLWHRRQRETVETVGVSLLPGGAALALERRF